MEIRSKVKALKGYNVPQGACTDGKYFYVIYEQKKPHRCKVAKYDFKGNVIKVSGGLKIGHGNDVCYRDGHLYITHSSGSLVIHKVNAKTLKKEKGIKVRIPKKYKGKGIKEFNGITCYGNGFLLRVMGGRGMAIIKKKTDKKGKKRYYVVKFYRTDTYHSTSQGMTADGIYVLRAFSHAQSGKNYIAKYSPKGKEKWLKRAEIDGKHIKGEMEGIFLKDGILYATTYVKEGKERYTYLKKGLSI